MGRQLKLRVGEMQDIDGGSDYLERVLATRKP
jgi:hypothetical protein